MKRKRCQECAENKRALNKACKAMAEMREERDEIIRELEGLIERLRARAFEVAQSPSVN